MTEQSLIISYLGLGMLDRWTSLLPVSCFVKLRERPDWVISCPFNYLQRKELGQKRCKELEGSQKRSVEYQAV